MSEVSTQTAYAGLPASQTLPTNTRAPGVMSNTSSAPECFINQRFSAQLQAYLIAYTNAISGDYSVYAE